MSEINFVETSAQAIYEAILSNLMDKCEEALYPGDERRIFGEALVAVVVGLFHDFNDKARQRLLRYARGTVLDAIGERYRVYRADPSSATAIFRFSVSAPQTTNIIIPLGTRVTADGSVYFATTDVAVLHAGESAVDVEAACTVGGSAYNGYTAGQITTLVDLIPYIGSVANVTLTAGGDDGEPYTTEGDDRLRERIRLAPSTLSTAGPESAYRYFVLSADPEIIDMAIDCPIDEPNTVNLYPLMTGGALPDEATLEKILDVLSDDVRPMTDLVRVFAPEIVEYDIEIKYYCTKDNEAVTIETIEGEGGAIEQYNAWQTSTLGRDINPDQLRRFLLAPTDGTGALFVDVVSPTREMLEKWQVARFSGSLVVTHEVVTG